MNTSAPPIRDAAALIIVDETGAEPKIFLGRRRPDQVFLPNTFVFPGGRVEKSDQDALSLSELRNNDTRKLLKDVEPYVTETYVRGFALAAIRETFEETGLLVGKAKKTAPIAEDPAWQSFHAEGIYPCLQSLTFFARAITPPGRPRRYDTRFFYVDSANISKTVSPRDDELRETAWFSLDEARQLDTPNITGVIIEDLAEWLGRNATDRKNAPTPFYFTNPRGQQRHVI